MEQAVRSLGVRDSRVAKSLAAWVFAADVNGKVVVSLLVRFAFSRDDAENRAEEGAMRRAASNVAMLMIGVILASAGRAMAHPAKQASLATRVQRLEFRLSVLQRRYQGVCDTLKFTNMSSVQDLQVRGMFIKLAAIC